MAGNVVAACAGVRRGTVLGKQMAEQKRRQRLGESLNRELAEAQKKMAIGIMAKYDQDQTGSLDKAELRPVLRDFSLECFHVDVQPSDEDISFLFSLYDKKDDFSAGGQKGAPSVVGMLDLEEILKVVDAWSEFVKQKDNATKLFEAHDVDKSSSLDAQELQAVLDEVKSDDVAEVPTIVTTWIFQQADVNGNGSLSCMELSRALCAFELWTGEKVREAGVPGPALAQGITGVRFQPKPVAPASSCCTIS